MEKQITEKETKELETQIRLLCEYMSMTEEFIKPIDEIACKAIDNIISMTMISLGRKHGLDYTSSDKSKIDEKKEKSIDDIMKDINEGTKD